MNGRIAFTGFANSGKDEAAIPLLARGWTRRAFGDYIKRAASQMTPTNDVFPFLTSLEGRKLSDERWNTTYAGCLLVVNKTLDPFTENDREKEIIRPFLEELGMALYPQLLEEMKAELPERCVNTRLMRVPEGKMWIEAGGLIVHVQRPGCYPATGFEAECLDQLYNEGLVDGNLLNDGSIEDLHAKVLRVAGVGEDDGTERDQS